MTAISRRMKKDLLKSVHLVQSTKATTIKKKIRFENLFSSKSKKARFPYNKTVIFTLFVSNL